MNLDKIIIKGAREHNLKNINLEIPKNKLVVITGVSGSGKSTLAFDTIYSEGQRRYVESLSTYARQFLGGIKKPKVDHIYGLSPAISIDGNKNVTIGGTLGVSGVTTLTGALDANSTADIAGDFSVATNKMTVASGSGNTTIAGTLDVSDTISGIHASLSGNLNVRVVGSRVAKSLFSANTSDLVIKFIRVDLPTFV